MLSIFFKSQDENCMWIYIASHSVSSNFSKNYSWIVKYGILQRLYFLTLHTIKKCPKDIHELNNWFYLFIDENDDILRIWSQVKSQFFKFVCCQNIHYTPNKPDLHDEKRICSKLSNELKWMFTMTTFLPNQLLKKKKKVSFSQTR